MRLHMTFFDDGLGAILLLVFARLSVVAARKIHVTECTSASLEALEHLDQISAQKEKSLVPHSVCALHNQRCLGGFP